MSIRLHRWLSEFEVGYPGAGAEASDAGWTRRVFIRPDFPDSGAANPRPALR